MRKLKDIIEKANEVIALESNLKDKSISNELFIKMMNGYKSKRARTREDNQDYYTRCTVIKGYTFVDFYFDDVVYILRLLDSHDLQEYYNFVNFVNIKIIPNKPNWKSKLQYAIQVLDNRRNNRR